MEKRTNIMKNLTDAASVFAALICFMIVYAEKKNFEPTEEMLHFYDLERVKVFLILGAFFALSGIVGAVSRRQPLVSLWLSSVAAAAVFKLYAGKQLGKLPMFYVIIALVALAGAAIFVGQWASKSALPDEDKPRPQALACGMLSCTAAVAALAAWLFVLQKSLKLQVFANLPIYVTLAFGMTAALMGVVFVFRMVKREERALVPAVICLSGGVCCLVVFAVKIAVAYIEGI